MSVVIKESTVISEGLFNTMSNDEKEKLYKNISNKILLRLKSICSKYSKGKEKYKVDLYDDTTYKYKELIYDVCGYASQEDVYKYYNNLDAIAKDLSNDESLSKYIKSVNAGDGDEGCIYVILKPLKSDMKESSYIVNSEDADLYIHMGLYESYLQNQIENQERIARALSNNGIISESTASKIIAVNEAKLTDNIKAKWNKFINFIKSVTAKFMEAMTNILVSEKTYLEKYKDIILKKKPKEDMEFSYTGDYIEAVNRLINTEVPVFNYEKHAAQLRQDGYGPILQNIMSGKDFKYDEGKDLPEQFKAYYLVTERGQTTGKFSNLNMKDIYNFCYNFKQIEDIVKKDENHLQQSTNQIARAINEELRRRGENTNQNAQTQTATNTTQSSQTQNSNNQQNNSQNQNESYMMEAEDGVKVGTNLNINTNAPSQMGSYNKNDAKNPDETTKAGNAAMAAKDQTTTEQDITAITNKWINVCRPLITAKLTACQQISKDYMAIIRAHVRSYVGNDKNKEDDRKTPQQATNYKKEN